MMGGKLWIVCAVLFAILLPGVKYAKDVRAYHISAIANSYVDYANKGVDQKTIWKDVSTKSEDKYLAELVSAYRNSDNTFSVIIK